MATVEVGPRPWVALQPGKRRICAEVRPVALDVDGSWLDFFPFLLLLSQLTTSRGVTPS